MMTDTVVRPPSWLSKADKTTFRHVISARSAMGRPVSASERDVVAEYSAARRRIVELRKLEAASHFPADKLKASGAIMAATKLARQLGKDLGLVGGEHWDENDERRIPLAHRAPGRRAIAR